MQSSIVFYSCDKAADAIADNSSRRSMILLLFFA